MVEDEENKNLNDPQKEPKDDFDMERIDPDEIIEGLPEEDRREIKSIFSRTMIAGVM